ncbi:Flp family type IVb pilin [Nocardioides sp. B-3]|uniref:Flp family type IVb pilin n=1 Tax=Nocardioides sp. B-3 TaxID=2895565 RepID=UPI0021536890|nr:Flp family type IVb pilin [Nocardioides sp. B-3]UUZ59716.1 Flp family type IVb pilin [Nocardioides sp. B-3]
MWGRIFTRMGDERGATAVEYGLMVAAIAITIIVGVTAFGVSVTQLFAIPAGVFAP